MVQEKDVLRPHLEIDHVAVFFGQMLQEGRCVAPEGEKVSDRKQALWAWRKFFSAAQFLKTPSPLTVRALILAMMLAQLLAQKHAALAPACLRVLVMNCMFKGEESVFRIRS